MPVRLYNIDLNDIKIQHARYFHMSRCLENSINLKKIQILSSSHIKKNSTY